MSANEFEAIINYLFKMKLLHKGSSISLYNWGEPFLNPELNDILNILGKNSLNASLSSNFIKKVDIKPENYKYISSVVFSLCSLEKENYKRIYGANIANVLVNFDAFLQKKSSTILDYNQEFTGSNINSMNMSLKKLKITLTSAMYGLSLYMHT